MSVAANAAARVGIRASNGPPTLSVCALVPYPAEIAPSQRFRIEQWMPRLEAQGVRVDLVPFVDRRVMGILHRPGAHLAKIVVLAAAVARRLGTIMSAARYDVAVVHRAATVLGPALAERMLRRRCPIVFDFDDAIFLSHTTAANRRFGWLKFAGKTAAICQMSSHVTAGNEYLAGYARRFNAAVTVVPSSVDTDRYFPGPRPSATPLTIGWMGSSTSQTYLEPFAPVLRDLTLRRDVRIVVVSDQRPAMDGMAIEWRPWSAATELDELRRFDIGIMPMPDDPWAQGKCAMKALLYMSVGAATVCADVGANREVIRHGVNGLLASSRSQWLASLESLIDDPDHRRRLGEAGRATVEERYSLSRCATLFAGAVREAAEGK